MEKEPDLIPLDRVLNDMYSDGIVADAARSYYYQHYATEEERKVMDREDKMHKVCAFIFVSVIAVIAVASVVIALLE